MTTLHVAVVGSEDHKGVVLFARPSHLVENAAEVSVHHRNHAVVHAQVLAHAFVAKKLPETPGRRISIYILHRMTVGR